MPALPAHQTPELPLDFEARLSAFARLIDRVLERFLADAVRPGEIDRPARLMEAMRHAVLAGGKRFRPFLTVEGARMLGRDDAGVLHAAAGIELLHCYSLIHDDLPAMDDDDLRRGKATVHRAFDEATAILAGDALQALAFELMADPANRSSAPVRAELVLGLARASGLGGMVGGQMLDLAAEGRYGAAILAEGEIRRLQAMKTGALLAFSVEAGAILAGADAETRSQLAAFGRALGAAFQVADDLLDREATAEATGKRTGKDAAKGKATLVDLLGIEGARQECDRLVAEALSAVGRFGPEANVLRDAARFTAGRKA
jgi:farnesyl diphosphate synthase